MGSFNPQVWCRPGGQAGTQASEGASCSAAEETAWQKQQRPLGETLGSTKSSLPLKPFPRADLAQITRGLRRQEHLSKGALGQGHEVLVPGVLGCIVGASALITLAES